jgi:UDP-3-O-[3-hydroxymyristoyl] glucosamine N-acyltransferase
LLVLGPCRSAGQGEVSFRDNQRYAAALEQTMAGAVIVHPWMQTRVPNSAIAIVTASAYENGRAMLRGFIPCCHLRPGVIALRWSTRKRGWMPPADIN